jgi:hypothetical protein
LQYRRFSCRHVVDFPKLVFANKNVRTCGFLDRLRKNSLLVPAPDFSPGERVFKPAGTLRQKN